jgi:hypothetical protein
MIAADRPVARGAATQAAAQAGRRDAQYDLAYPVNRRALSVVLARAVLGIGQPYDGIAIRGVFVKRRMRMILIPLALVAAVVVTAVTRRPGKLSRPMDTKAK